MPAVVLAQTINSISPVLGNVGTLVTLGGTNLNLVSSVAVNGTACILLDKSSTSLRLLVMPGASTGTISTTGGTPAMSATAFTVTSTSLGTAQQGPKLIGTGTVGPAYQGTSVALSADGGTLAVGGFFDNNGTGATWVFTRSGMGWAQQGPKLVGTGAMGAASQGTSVTLSADGSTLALGGITDNSGAGATWVFTRSGTSWAQQGPKLVGTGAVGPAYQGVSVALSADGSTLAVGGTDNNFGAGATWVFSTVSTPLAQIASASLQASPNFFPNPIAEQLTITGGASSGTLYLLDGLGRTLLTLPYRQGQPISLASLAPGCYWLRLNQGVARPLVKR